MYLVSIQATRNVYSISKMKSIPISTQPWKKFMMNVVIKHINSASIEFFSQSVLLFYLRSNIYKVPES